MQKWTRVNIVFILNLHKKLFFLRRNKKKWAYVSTNFTPAIQCVTQAGQKIQRFDLLKQFKYDKYQISL